MREDETYLEGKGTYLWRNLMYTYLYEEVPSYVCQ